MFRYVKGVFDYSFYFHNYPTRPRNSICFHGYVDSVWAGDIDRKRSTSGYVFKMFGVVISWMSKQKDVDISSMKNS